MRWHWRLPVLAWVSLAGCGRTPGIEALELIVPVIDERTDPVGGADVELRAAAGDDVDVDARIIAVRRTDPDGVTVLPYPGAGTYELRADTDLTCCIRTGTVQTALTQAEQLVVVETTTGPCPTWTPLSCGR